MTLIQQIVSDLLNQSIDTSNATTKCRKHFVVAFEVPKRAYNFSINITRSIRVDTSRCVKVAFERIAITV
jgi:hypothetical protein